MRYDGSEMMDGSQEMTMCDLKITLIDFAHWYAKKHNVIKGISFCI